MAKNDLLQPALLRKLLDYDPETGVLTHRERPASLFTQALCTPETQARRWNVKHAGKPAFTVVVKGHNVGCIFSKRLYAHRVIWALMTGKWPIGDIDHINGIRSDNRWANLRDVPHAINARNRKLGANNTSGVNGVHWHALRGKWNARIKVGGKTYSLGLFSDLGAAAQARRDAEFSLGFTERHGRS